MLYVVIILESICKFLRMMEGCDLFDVIFINL